MLSLSCILGLCAPSLISKYVGDIIDTILPSLADDFIQIPFLSEQLLPWMLEQFLGALDDD